MSDPSSPFNWLTFLLGFAIALWLAIVVLFLLPEKQADRPAAHAPGGPGNVSRPIRRPVKPMWIEAGGEPMFCTNTDAGGGYVEDAGGGYVDDGGGGYVDDGGGGYVDDGGGGYVDDNAPRTPVPSDKHREIVRGPDQYHCETNDGGGGYVEDSSGRSAVQPMPANEQFHCWKDGAGNAVVLRSEGAQDDRTYIRVKLNRKHNVVLYEEISPDAATLVDVPAGTAPPPSYLYCMVALADAEELPQQDKYKAEPAILDREGTCIAGCPQ